MNEIAPRRRRTIVMTLSIWSMGAATIGCLPGCSTDLFDHLTRPLGDPILRNIDIARIGINFVPDGDRGVRVGRGDFAVVFINRTRFRALGTFGGYDPQDQDTLVAFGQLGVNSQLDLEPNSVTPPFAIPVTRAFSVGGARLLALIFADEELRTSSGRLWTFAIHDRSSLGMAQIPDFTVDFFPADELLYEGIGFSAAPLEDPQKWVATEGSASPVSLLLGRDYEEGSILIFGFVEDPTSANGFIIKLLTPEDLGVHTQTLLSLPMTPRIAYLEQFGLEDNQIFGLLMTIDAPKQAAPPFIQSPGIPGNNPEVSVENASARTITALFLGPERAALEVPSGEVASLELDPGEYQYILATDSTNAIPFAGNKEFQSGFIYVGGFRIDVVVE